jgi:hypothetical protein
MLYEADALSSVAYAQGIAIFGSHRYLLKLLVLSIRNDVGPCAIFRFEQSV